MKNLNKCNKSDSEFPFQYKKIPYSTSYASRISLSNQSKDYYRMC